VRKDGLHNREKLIDAAGDLVRVSGSTVPMNAIADRAGVSLATAYRHFPSVEAIFEAYMLRLALEWREYSLSLSSTGFVLLAEVARRWVDLCLVHGPATVHMRSRRGYLVRLHEGADYLLALRDALLRPLACLFEALNLEPSRDLEQRALFLWNLLFDPREIVDLTQEVGLSPHQCTVQLLAAHRGALLAWTPKQ
jgi:AcrR family transcriptional regulator